MAKSSESRITLEALIKLKRHEAPEAAFWDRFDRDLENRRLRALMKNERSRGFHGWRSFGWVSALSGSAAAVVAFFAVPQITSLSGGLAVNEPDSSAPVALHETSTEVATLSVSPAPTFDEHSLTLTKAVSPSFDQVESRFVDDALSSDFEVRHFRRVLANPAFQGPRQAGAEFVADALMTNSRPRATFLIDRSAGQF